MSRREREREREREKDQNLEPKQGHNNERILGHHIETLLELKSKRIAVMCHSRRKRTSSFHPPTIFSTQGGMSLNAFSIVNSFSVGVGDSLLGGGAVDLTLQTLLVEDNEQDETEEVQSADMRV